LSAQFLFLFLFQFELQAFLFLRFLFLFLLLLQMLPLLLLQFLFLPLFLLELEPFLFLRFLFLFLLLLELEPFPSLQFLFLFLFLLELEPFLFLQLLFLFLLRFSGLVLGHHTFLFEHVDRLDLCCDIHYSTVRIILSHPVLIPRQRTLVHPPPRTPSCPRSNSTPLPSTQMGRSRLLLKQSPNLETQHAISLEKKSRPCPLPSPVWIDLPQKQNSEFPRSSFPAKHFFQSRDYDRQILLYGSP